MATKTKKQPARGLAIPAEEQALLQAIWADPKAREPRLVHADYLQERGDPRGEYIALRLRGVDDPKVTSRALAIERKLGGKWLGAARPLVFSLAFDFGGLLASVSCQAVKFVEGFDVIVGIQPRLAIEITSLRTKKRETIAKIAALDFTRVHEARIWSQELDDDVLATLAPTLGKCKRLSIGGAYTAEGIRALEAHVAGLEHVHLHRWTDDTKTGLDEGPLFTEIPQIASKLSFEQPRGARAYRC